jgi:hypothetical protein
MRIFLARVLPLFWATALQAASPATPATFTAAAEKLAALAAEDLGLLDAYAAAEGRTPEEIEAAVARMRANYPEGVVIRRLPEGALESSGAAGFDLRLVRDGTGLDLIAIRTARPGPRHAVLLTVRDFVGITLESAGLVWPAGWRLVGRGRVIHPARGADFDLAALPLASVPSGGQRVGGTQEETLTWKPLRIGPQDFHLVQREVAPPPPRPVRIPEPVVAPVPTPAPLPDVVSATPAPTPVAVSPPVAPPNDPPPSVPPPDALEPPVPTLVSPPPPAATPIAPAPVLPAPTPIAPAPVPAPAPSVAVPPAAPPPPGKLQGVWSGAYMETGDPNTYKMRLEIRTQEEGAALAFAWGEQQVSGQGRLEGDSLVVTTTGTPAFNGRLTYFADRDALKGSGSWGDSKKIRSFYLLRLKDLP